MMMSTIIGSIAVWVLRFLVFVALVANYCLACVLPGEATRLSWYAVTASTLPEGTQLAERDLRNELGRLPDGHGFVDSAEDAVGKYLVHAAEEGQPLATDAIEDSPSIDESGLILSVPLQGTLAAVVRPGWRLQFAKHSGGKTSFANNGSEGFRVVAVSRTEESASAAVLIPNTEDLSALASGDWTAMAMPP